MYMASQETNKFHQHLIFLFVMKGQKTFKKIPFIVRGEGVIFRGFHKVPKKLQTTGDAFRLKSCCR